MEGWRSRTRRNPRPLEVDVDAGGDDAVGYLDKRGGHDAVTLPVGDGVYVIFFRKTEPNRSELLEEFSHVLQHERDDFADRDMKEMVLLREIEVGECLERNADRLQIPEHEREQTRNLLQCYRKDLRDLEAWR